jgi:hypothetical protein
LEYGAVSLHGYPNDIEMFKLYFTSSEIELILYTYSIIIDNFHRFIV